MSLQGLLKKGAGPYGQSIKARICATASLIPYTGQDWTNKQAMTVDLCDGDKCIRLVCYDAGKFPKLRVDNVIVLRELIVKSVETPAYLLQPPRSSWLVASTLVTHSDWPLGNCEAPLQLW